MALPNKGDLVKTLSIRDVIGPIMIGPSSSHTAGALRIALMTRQMLNARPKTVEFRLYGSFSHTYQGHGTDKALVAGMLGLAPDDERIRDSFCLAHEQGLNFRFTPLPEVEVKHPNTVEILVEDEQGSHLCVRGESIGGGAAVISALNGVEVHLTGEHHSIVTEQRDVQGVLAHITARLNAANLNIASVRLFRTKKDKPPIPLLRLTRTYLPVSQKKFSQIPIFVQLTSSTPIKPPPISNADPKINEKLPPGMVKHFLSLMK